MAAEKKRYDLIVLGAGAGGMTAATVAALEGLRVLLIEKSEYVGGTTAISGGMIWVPQNHLMARAGLPDSRSAAEAYLAATVPEDSARAALATYLDTAPDAIRYLCEKTEVRLTPVTCYPDYYPDLEGATLGGRVLEPEPFDGRMLGPDAFQKLRDTKGAEDGLLLPEKMAETYYHLATQHRSAWTHELDLRAYSDLAWWNHR